MNPSLILLLSFIFLSLFFRSSFASLPLHILNWYSLMPEPVFGEPMGTLVRNRGSRSYSVTRLQSTADKTRHWPGGKSPSQKLPMRTRINRSVGWPVAAVMRRT